MSVLRGKKWPSIIGILLFAVTNATAWAATTWSGGDIGAVRVSGSYTVNGGTYSVQGSGADIWGTADEFQFVSTPLIGDGSITAHVVSQTNTNQWAKAGVMIREALAAGAKNAAVLVTPAEGTVLQARTLTNGSTASILGPFVKAPYWVRLVRAGNSFSGYASADGVSWKLISTQTLTIASQVYMGFAVTSHANGTLSTAALDNVTVASGNTSPSDSQAPTVPSGLSVTNLTSTTLTLSWSSSGDLPDPGGSGVGGYYVYRNGNTASPIATVTIGTSFNDTKLVAAMTYTYQVAAFDKASPANVSAPSSALSVTTPGGTGPSWSSGDIGAVQVSGSYTVTGSTYGVQGSGADIWGTADEFQFVSTPLAGDGSITAHVVSQTNTNQWAKAGVMIRETLATGAKNAAVLVTPAEGTVLQARTLTNGSTASILGPFVKAPYWVRLVRAGNNFSGYASADGVSWKLISTQTITMMAPQVYAGLVVSSHANGTISTAVFDNLQAPATNPNAIALSPRSAALTLSQSQQFAASANSGATIGWSVDGIVGGNSTVGTISLTGLYRPPVVAGTHIITATNALDPNSFATANLAVTDLGGIYTYHVDLARTGQNLQEYALTPATVSSGRFGKRWSCPLDGDVYAQPLYVANLPIGGGTHNVLFVATEHNSVYAFDADSTGCVTYWRVSFLGTGVTSLPAADVSCGDVLNEYGITGTPVIDPAGAVLYLVASTKESGSYFQRLHAIDITTGAERPGSPVVLQASMTNASGKTVAFSALRQNQRGGLAFSNGGVYVSWSSHCDHGAWWGWLMRYDASSLAQTAVFNTTPDGSSGGVWMAGGAPAVDSSGSLFFTTGNGTFDDTIDLVPPVAPKSDFGESFLKLDPASLMVQDFYTPSQEAAWSGDDLDISSSGVTVLPDGAGPAGHPNVLVGSDKGGHFWMLDRMQMQRFSSTSDNAVQFLTLPSCAQDCVYSTPAYWNGTVYLGSSWNFMAALTLSGGLIAKTSSDVVAPSSVSTESYTWPGPTPMISASANANGVVWALDNSANGTGGAAGGPAVLRAYDAMNLAKTLYDSRAAADTAGPAVKFTVPVVANGHVYVTGRSRLTVYGLAP